jgi:hypothetical protein
VADQEYVARPNPLRRYRDLNQAELDLIDQVKALEDGIAMIWRRVRDSDNSDAWDAPDFDVDAYGIEVDPDWLRIAKRHLQEGTSALIRSVARPYDPFEY